MLVDLMSDKPIDHVPYEEEYRRLMARMSATEISGIKERLNEMIEGTEIQTAGWMPGSDWTDNLSNRSMKRRRDTTRTWPRAASG